MIFQPSGMLFGRKEWCGEVPVRNMGDQAAGVCEFEKTKYQNRKEIRVGTRAGGIGIYCAHEALQNAGFPSMI